MDGVETESRLETDRLSWPRMPRWQLVRYMSVFVSLPLPMLERDRDGKG